MLADLAGLLSTPPQAHWRCQHPAVTKLLRSPKADPVDQQEPPTNADQAAPKQVTGSQQLSPQESQHEQELRLLWSPCNKQLITAINYLEKSSWQIMWFLSMKAIAATTSSLDFLARHAPQERTWSMVCRMEKTASESCCSSGSLGATWPSPPAHAALTSSSEAWKGMCLKAKGLSLEGLCYVAEIPNALPGSLLRLSRR